MRWKTKAKIQNIVSLLPSDISYSFYYWIQRNFGGLSKRKVDPTVKLNAGIEIWRQIQKSGRDPVNKVFFEVGTGRATVIPIAYWLMGAKKIITVDINPYLKYELVKENLDYIFNHREAIEGMFGSLLNMYRFEELFALYSEPFSMSSFLNICNIEYLAPGDASHINCKDASIDFHTSFQVLEHIPPQILKNILEEGNRIVSSNGLFVHIIDYADHFCYWDHDISAINFLQYSDQEWDAYAGNRYMYMNRLRHDDFLDIYKSVGHKILLAETDFDEQSHELLQSNDFSLDARFSDKAIDTLSVRGSTIVSCHP